MKKALFTLLTFAIVLSCDNEEPKNPDLEISNIQNEFEGMTFENWNSLSKYHADLVKLQDEYEILEKISDNKHQSLLEKVISGGNDEEMQAADVLTFPLMAIMNTHYRFKVGDSIVSFMDNEFYISLEDSDLYEPLDRIQVNVLDDNQLWEKQGLVDEKLVLGGQSTGGKSWKDFTRQQYLECSTNRKKAGRSGKPMRYFQQLKSERVNESAVLYIETKLQYRNRRNKLRDAGSSERNYTYNINGTLGIEGFGPFGGRFITENINFRKTVRCTKSRWNRQIIADAFPSKGSWHINLRGTITHHINGDVNSNKWIAPVRWY